MRGITLGWLPAWFWRRPVGLMLGPVSVIILTVAIILFDRLIATILNPSLLYTLFILAFAYGWGGRVGFATALASFLLVWYAFIPPLNSFLVPLASDWTRLILTAVTYGALALVGDAFRRLRRANARLAGTVERLDAIIASMADGVLVLDRQGNLVQTNEAMRRLFGGAVPQTIAERAARWHTWDAERNPLPGGSPSAAALAGVITTEHDMVIDTLEGQELPISVSSAPIRRRSGAITGAVIVCRDVSEVRRLQQAKDDFLAIASHELKTPLTSLRGYAQLLHQRLLSSGPTDERMLRYLTTIDNQARRIAELVDTLLDVSRLDAGRVQLRRERFDLVALVREAATQLGELSARHTIAVNAEVAAISGDWDRDRVEQIIVNLLANAIRYSPDGGAITVTVGLRARRTDAASDEHDASEHDASVRVRDRGIGIAADQLERIFERFHRVQEGALRGFVEAQRGMGLGLFISRELAVRHGGRLWAESDGTGRGATFTLTLPQSGQPPARPTPRG